MSNLFLWVAVGASAYLTIGIFFIVVGPASRERKREIESLQVENLGAAPWKFHAFAVLLAIGIAIGWPVLVLSAGKHEATMAGRADVDTAVTLVCHSLLSGKFSDQSEISNVALALARGPVRYSTHELATATALHLYKQASRADLLNLREMQIAARATVLEWAMQGKVRSSFARIFEDALYRLFTPVMVTESR